MTSALEAKFEQMGARARVSTIRPLGQGRSWNGRRRLVHMPQPVRVDVRRDDKGEYFDLQHRNDVHVEVLDVRPRDRHLVLLVREPRDHRGREQKSRFLCGHDERAWFVAAVPESARVRNVQDAKDALKPAEVWAAMREYGVKPDQRDRRRTAGFVRQGEWFFIPRPRLNIPEAVALRNEPIRRSAGKPHYCQFLYRTGGETVRVNHRYTNGLTDSEFQKLPPKEREQRGWRRMQRNARVYVKGAIRHPDHKTVWLALWHEVVMNTETQARAMQHVAFLD